MTYYRSIRLINGKPKKMIVDEYGDIVGSPTDEQMRDSIRGDPPKRCYKCGRDDSKRSDGRECWSRIYNNGIWNGKYICYGCTYHIDKSKTEEYFLKKSERKACCACGSDKTTGNWYIYGYDNTGKLYTCSNCHQKYDLNSSSNVEKSKTQWRNGVLDRYTSVGKGVIGQWIAGKVLGLKDTNIENNNFNQPVDLCGHSIYDKIDVKIATLKEERWTFGNITCAYDMVLFICMDNNEPWKIAEMAYLIPMKEIVKHGKDISIYKNPSRSTWYARFEIDSKPYKDVYDSVDIPRFFDPLELWKGNYCKKENKHDN